MKSYSSSKKDKITTDELFDILENDFISVFNQKYDNLLINAFQILQNQMQNDELIKTLKEDSVSEEYVAIRVKELLCNWLRDEEKKLEFTLEEQKGEFLNQIKNLKRSFLCKERDYQNLVSKLENEIVELQFEMKSEDIKFKELYIDKEKQNEYNEKLKEIQELHNKEINKLKNLLELNKNSDSNKLLEFGKLNEEIDKLKQLNSNCEKECKDSTLKLKEKYKTKNKLLKSKILDYKTKFMNSESNFNIIQKKYEKEINEIKNSEEELYKKKLNELKNEFKLKEDNWKKSNQSQNNIEQIYKSKTIKIEQDFINEKNEIQSAFEIKLINLETQNQNLEKEIQNKESEINKKDKELDLMKMNFQEINEKYIALNQKTENYLKENKSIKFQMENLKSENRSLILKTEDYNFQLKKKEVKVDEINKKDKEYQENIINLQNKLENFEKSLTNNNKQIQMKDKLLIKAQTTIENQNFEIQKGKDLLKKNKILSKKIQFLLDEKITIYKQIRNIYKDFKDKFEILKNLTRNDILQLNERYQEIYKKLINTKTNETAKINETEEILNNLKKQIRDLLKSKIDFENEILQKIDNLTNIYQEEISDIIKDKNNEIENIKIHYLAKYKKKKSEFLLNLQQNKSNYDLKEKKNLEDIEKLEKKIKALERNALDNSKRSDLSEEKAYLEQILNLQMKIKRLEELKLENKKNDIHIQKSFGSLRDLSNLRNFKTRDKSIDMFYDYKTNNF